MALLKAGGMPMKVSSCRASVAAAAPAASAFFLLTHFLLMNTRGTRISSSRRIGMAMM